MSAERHIKDALYESQMLSASIDSLLEKARTQPIGLQELAHLRRLATVIRIHTARAELDLERIPQIDRRLPAGQTITLGA